jgi:hypothetical protein
MASQALFYYFRFRSIADFRRLKNYLMKSYLEQRREQKLGIKPAADEKKEKAEKSNFFKTKIKNAPAKCENCRKPLAGTMAINAAAVVAHVLPKRKKNGVPSMATNPLNVVYLCGDCHTNMDNKGAAFVASMKIYPLLLKRVALMFPHIPDEEKKNVPEHLLPANLLP